MKNDLEKITYRLQISRYSVAKCIHLDAVVKCMWSTSVNALHCKIKLLIFRGFISIVVKNNKFVRMMSCWAELTTEAELVH